LNYCGNLQADHHPHNSHVTSSLVAPLKFIYSSIEVSGVLVRCSFQAHEFSLSDIPSFIPRMSAGFTSHIVQGFTNYSPGSCNHWNLARLL
jgi:hypothetical protein